MRETFRINNEYESYAIIDRDNKFIEKIWCNCYNFQNKRIKSVGKGYCKKFFALPCKHLQQLVHSFIRQGYKLKSTNEMEGSETLKYKLKKEIRFKFNDRCSDCGMTEEEHLEQYGKSLEFHRIIPGFLGGLYSIDNILLLCNECHNNHNKGDKNRK